MGSSGADTLELPTEENDLPSKTWPRRGRGKLPKTSPKSVALVEDVFVRHHVEDLIKRVENDRQRKKSIFGGVVNHPLFAVLIPFIPLVISVMTLLNDSKTRLIKEVTEQKSFYNQNISALSKDLLSRTERGVLLRYALLGKLGTCNDIGLTEEYKAACQRQIQDLIYERKKNYDAAYLSWNANYPDYIFNIGQIMEREQPGTYPQLKNVVFDLSKSTLKRMDSCLSRLYSGYQRSGRLPVDDSNEADCASFEVDKDSVRNCGVVLAEELHALVTVVFNKLQQNPQYGSKGTSSSGTVFNRAGSITTLSTKLQAGENVANSSSHIGENNGVLGLISSSCQSQPSSKTMINADAQP
jgi:hypothetical protein